MLFLKINKIKMKKLFTLIFCVVFASIIKAQTANEVIESFIQANGGKEKLNSINNLMVESLVTLEQFGITINITTVKEKNKLFRIQSKSPMTEEANFTLITDTAGYTYSPAMNSPMGATEAQLVKFTPQELETLAYLKECDGMFAQLVDYTDKGSKAELLKDANINGVDCYGIKLTLKTNQEMNFYISKANYQVRRLQVAAPLAMEMMGMGAMMRMFGRDRFGNRKVDIDFEKYKLFDGVPFPTKQTVQLGMMQLELQNTSYKFNVPSNARWYEVK